MLIIDCEVEKAIPDSNEPPIVGVSYCGGWRDFANMGISCICAYDYQDQRYRVFCKDNFKEFWELVSRRSIIIGFNSLAFDNQLCKANGIPIPTEKSYDLLVEIWMAAGLGVSFEYPSHIGFGLDAVCRTNFGIQKSGSGANAPVWWQRGEIGHVIDYCLNDVKMTKTLVDHIVAEGRIKDPRNPDKILKVRSPGLPTCPNYPN